MSNVKFKKTFLFFSYFYESKIIITVYSVLKDNRISNHESEEVKTNNH